MSKAQRPGDQSTTSGKVKIIGDVKVNLPQIAVKLPNEVNINLDQKDKEPINVTVTNKPENQWRSPHTIIALGTLLALGFSFYALHDTNRQWKKINEARISIFNPGFYTFRTISFDSPYKDSIEGMQIPGDALDNPNYEMIKYLIAAYYINGKDPIPGSLALTKFQCQEELRKRKIFDFNNIRFYRVYRPQVTIQNVGQTACSVDSIVIRNFHMDSTHNWNAVDTDRVVAPEHDFPLEPSQKFIYNYSLLAYDTVLPDFHFKFDVHFKNSDSVINIKKVFVEYKLTDFHVRNQ